MKIKIYISILVLFIIYVSFYLNFRNNKEIIHFSNTIGHRVEAVLPDGTKVFALAILNKPENIDLNDYLIETGNKLEKRKNKLNLFFYPLIKCETYYWIVFVEKFKPKKPES
ncbi:hypothetical protein [Algibacter sp. 2305UL17-15]|uniref:hypothetical protein n=1 Tax=Algibacter sp. 2305UL17-15 TaxID=3231268 RepID=UPI003459455A